MGNDSDQDAKLPLEIAAPMVGELLGGPVGTAVGKLYVNRVRGAAAKAFQDRELELERFVSENPQLAALVVPEDPQQAEIFLRLYRSTVDALDKRAIGPLVRLTSSYIGKKPDWFFLATAKLFEELVGSDFDTLRLILAACLLSEGPDAVVAFVRPLPDEPTGERVEVTWRVQGEDRERGFGYLGNSFERGAPICVALKRHGLAKRMRRRPDGNVVEPRSDGFAP
jgi:hypothetical protein